MAWPSGLTKPWTPSPKRNAPPRSGAWISAFAPQDRPRARPHFGSAAGTPRFSHWLSSSALILSRCGPGLEGSMASGPLRSIFWDSSPRTAALRMATLAKLRTTMSIPILGITIWLLLSREFSDTNPAKLKLTNLRLETDYPRGRDAERSADHLAVTLADRLGAHGTADRFDLDFPAIELGRRFAILDFHLQHILGGQRLAVDHVGDDASLDGDLDLVPVSLLEVLDVLEDICQTALVGPVQLQLLPVQKHPAVVLFVIGRRAELEFQMEVLVELLRGVETAQSFAGGNEKTILDLEDVVAAGPFAIQFLIVRFRPRWTIAALPTGQILAVEQEFVTFFQLEIVRGRGRPRHGAQKRQKENRRQQSARDTIHVCKLRKIMGFAGRIFDQPAPPARESLIGAASWQFLRLVTIS